MSRDVGISVALPDGHALWVFGDTAVFRRVGVGAWKETGFIDGSTAFTTRYRRGAVPRGGDTPSGIPARFIPSPTNVYMPDGSGRPCNRASNAAYPARWPTGAAVMASNPSQVFVTYASVCVTRAKVGGIIRSRVEGWGYLLYNWRTRHIDRAPVDVIAPRRNGAQLADSRIFGSPHFNGHRLTLFSSHCTALILACRGGRVWSVTVADSGAALRRLSNTKLTRLRVAAPEKWEPITVSIGHYAGGFRLIELTSVGGDYRVFAAPTVGGPWRLTRSGALPGCRHPSTGFCYALTGHPELSTSTRMFVSYMKPDMKPGGHMVVTAIPK